MGVRALAPGVPMRGVGDIIGGWGVAPRVAESGRAQGAGDTGGRPGVTGLGGDRICPIWLP
jgi:hypothetical protein